MTKFADLVLIGFVVGALYVALPATIVWGWVRCFTRSQPRTTFSTLSLIGFALATASALLAISALVYSAVIGGFPYYDPRLLRIYRIGALLSLCGIVFAVIGVWRSSTLRWHSLACTVGTLLFWFVAAMEE